MLIRILRQLQNYCIRFVNPIAHLFGVSIHHRWKATLTDLDVTTIIDVGVANGTSVLLKAFPAAHFYFVEPNPKYHKHIQGDLCSTFSGTLIPKAAGSTIETLDLSEEDEGSSFLRDTAGKKMVQVAVEPLDQLLAEYELRPNALLKIDTEGYELEVLKGATNTLSQIQYVMVELRLGGIDTYNPSELVVFLYEHGFQWMKTMKVAHRRWGVSYLDVIFERR